MSWFSRITSGLTRTAKGLGDNLKEALGITLHLDATTRATLEDILLAADIGPTATQNILQDLEKTSANNTQTPQQQLAAIMTRQFQSLVPTQSLTALVSSASSKPLVIVMAGVNGAGKTTTIGKLAAQWTSQGHRIVVAAADTFRAAATAQLAEWTQRANTSQKQGGSVTIIEAETPTADAASVAYQGLQNARESKADILLIDTAGRLPNRQDLLAELPKLARVLKKQDANAPHHTWLVLDATLGQSTLAQVAQFQKSMGNDMPITGLIVTKLDGTAKAGFLLALANQTHPLPIMAIGVGESLEDLGPFNPQAFAHALLGLPTLSLSEC